MKRRIVCTIVCILPALPAFAQSAPWTGTVRGSWVQTGAAADGDVVLASKNSVCQIVVADNENPAVRQAAEFLAGDIEKISGYKPPVVQSAGAEKVNIRLVTVGRSPAPAAIDVASLKGQWESYRVVTERRDVWLIGSNPRGTAFAAYTLSERLGVDPIYLWSGYWPEHHDPLILKRVNFYHFKKKRYQVRGSGTTIERSGTSSLVLSTWSRIYRWHNDFYLRKNVRWKNERCSAF